MPKSKRSQVFSLTKVGKRSTRDHKKKAIEEIQKLSEIYKYAYIIRFENERNNLLKKLRDSLKPGRLYGGRNKVIQFALGSDENSECQKGISKLGQALVGPVGILFTHMNADDLKNVLDEHCSKEFARSGAVALASVALEAGEDALSKFPQSLEPQLRNLGLPTVLKNGNIRLLGNYQVCEEGKILTPQQCQVLKFMGIAMASFSATAIAQWSKETSQVTMIVN